MRIYSLNSALDADVDQCYVEESATFDDEKALPPSSITVRFDQQRPLYQDCLWPINCRILVVRNATAQTIMESCPPAIRLVATILLFGKRRPRQLEEAYWGLQFAHWIDMDYRFTTFEVVKGQQSISGVEKRSLEHRPTGSVVRRHPRMADHGLFIREASLDGTPFFRVRQNPYPLMCTEHGRKLLVSLRLSNLDFIEMGETTAAQDN